MKENVALKILELHEATNFFVWISSIISASKSLTAAANFENGYGASECKWGHRSMLSSIKMQPFWLDTQELAKRFG